MYAIQVPKADGSWGFEWSWRKFFVHESYQGALNESKNRPGSRIVKINLEWKELEPIIVAESTINVVALEGREGYWIELDANEPSTADTIKFSETGRRFKPV
jgi:hypothetical protein